MKFGERQYGPVQPLGKPRIWGPIAAARSFTSGLMKLGKSLEDINEDRIIEKTKFQVSESNLDMAQRVAGIEEDLAKKEASAADLEGLSGVEMTDANGNPVQSKPMYEYRADLALQRANQAIDEISASIEDPRAREAWKLNQQRVATEWAGKIALASIKEQRAYQQDTIMQRINEAEEARDGVGMELAARMLDDSHPRKKQLIQRGKAQQELSQFEVMLSSDNPDLLDEAASQLGPEYKGNMPPRMVATIKSQLQSRAYTLRNRQGEKVEADKVILRDDSNNAIRDLLDVNRSTPDPMYIATLQATLTAAGMNKEARDLADAVAIRPVLDEYRTKNQAERMAELRAVKTMSVGSPQAMSRRDMLVAEMGKIDTTLKSAERDNQYQAAIEKNLVDRRVIDFSDPQKIELGLTFRRSQLDLVRYKDGYLRQGLLPSEANALAARIEGAPIQEQMQMASLIHRTLGDYAPVVFNQMKMSETGEVWGVAADLIYQGQPEAAQLILEGARAQKGTDRVPMFKSSSEDYKIALEDNFGSSFAGSARLRFSTQRAVEMAYARQSSLDGDFSGEFNRDRYDKVFKQVTGEFVRQGDRFIVPPVFGMNQDQWNDWLLTLGNEYYDDLGGFNGFKTREGARMINRGDWQLQHIGNGMYSVRDTNTGGLIYKQGSNTEPFVLIYTPDPQRWTPRPAPPPEPEAPGAVQQDIRAERLQGILTVRPDEEPEI